MKIPKIRTQIYIPVALHNKISYIAGMNGRTISKEVEFLIRNAVENYENTNNEITEKDIQEARDAGML